MFSQLMKVRGFNNYWVSVRGIVFSSFKLRKKPLKQYNTKGGYKRVYLYDGLGGKKGKRVHILVLEAFKRARKKGEVCRHLNGDPSDNRAENLTWGTQSQNNLDKRGHGTALLGEKNHKAKLKSEDIIPIRMLSKYKSVSLRQIANVYRVVPSTIFAIVSGKTWRHIPDLI